ncbi:MAG: glycosyltransferase family A protein [Candidatus Buchananbacteria bacterium]
MSNLLKLLPKEIKDYIYYFPFKIYEKMNKKYNKKTLLIEIVQKTVAKIIGDQITKISIIITTRNRLDALKKYALTSLECLQFNDLPYEIIIIDNNSTDDTYLYLQQYVEKNKLVKIFQEDKIGASAGRNRGIKEASGELLMFMDDDCEVDENWLSRTYKFHSQGNFFMGQGQIYDVVLEKLLLHEENGKVDLFGEGNVATGNISIRKKLFDYVSFNENIRLLHEDKDLVGQIRAFWPDFKFFIDRFPIKHYRASSIDRNVDKSYSKKSIIASVKNYNLSYLTRCIIKRNLDISLSIFSLNFILRESFFLPLEVSFFLRGNVLMLMKTKIKIYKQLLYMRNISKQAHA